jgi:hypothetical protein
MTDEHDVNQVIGLVPADNTALRAALEAGRITSNPSGLGLRFEIPTGTLVDSTYDLFRPTHFLLSCVGRVDVMDVAYITRKEVKTPPYALCYHATAASNLPT